ncbi:MAG: hypothetical protein ACKOX6_06480 [Bdellovibrio sp.]
MARIWGLGQVYPEYQSVFFDGKTPYIVVKADTLDKVREVTTARPDAIIWADVRISKGNVAYILPPHRDADFLNAKAAAQKANPTAQIMMGGKLSDYSWEQINEFYNTTPALKEYYEQFPKTRFILNVVDNVTDVESTVVEAIKDLNPDNRTLIQSDANVISMAIKSLKPVWLYGTGTPDLMRLMSFDSMWVLPAVQFKGDVFIAPFKIMNRPGFNDDVITEMQRRKKKIFLGPIKNEEDFKRAANFKIDGYITEDLKQLESWMH